MKDISSSFFFFFCRKPDTSVAGDTKISHESNPSLFVMEFQFWKLGFNFAFFPFNFPPRWHELFCFTASILNLLPFAARVHIYKAYECKCTCRDGLFLPRDGTVWEKRIFFIFSVSYSFWNNSIHYLIGPNLHV